MGRAPIPTTTDDAVTPVIGTVLILSITLLTVGVVLLTGNPLIDRARDHAAVARMVPEMAEVRQAMLELTPSDSSRVVPVTVAAGHLGLAEGGRFLVVADMATGCSDLQLDGWDEPLSGYLLTDATPAAGCPAGTAFEQCLADGAGLTCTPALGPAPPGAAGGGHATYRIRALRSPDVGNLCDSNAAAAGDDDVCAEAWLFSTARLGWSDRVESGDQAAVSLEAGVVLVDLGRTSVAKAPMVDEAGVPGSPVGLLVRLPTVDAGLESGAPSGQRDVQLDLTGLHDRTDAAAQAVRISATGANARGFCSALLLRNTFVGASYVEMDGVLATAAGGTCLGDGDDPVSFHVRYDPAATPTFPFRLIQMEVHALVRL